MGNRFNIKISKNMRDLFVELTGDASSLHIDEKFARRSMYRDQVVHGMLPVSFIVMIPFYLKLNNFRFKKISARFLKPIFIGDNISFDFDVVNTDDNKKCTEVEFSLKNVTTQVVLTTGSFVVVSDNKKIKKNVADNDKRIKMVRTTIVEKMMQFEQIEKGYKDKFPFSISLDSICVFHNILQEGLISDSKFDLSDKKSNDSFLNILGLCLFSTFVGVCIPGQQATFIDFSATFAKDLDLSCNYELRGEVAFKSESTFTLVEDISISDEKNKDIYVSGKIKVQVNTPPINMLSCDNLRNNELDLKLKEKVVLITGASRGIGETMAKLFALHGCKVIVNYFKGQEDAHRIVRDICEHGGDAIAICADVSDRKQVKEMIVKACQHYETINILVNNAVKDASPIAFLDLSWENVQKDIDVCLKGAFNCCQETVPMMMKNKEGKIINITTVFTDNPPSKQTKYIIAKSALVGLTRSLAVELAPFNIQINMVSPSIVETDLTKHVPKMFLDKMKNDTPMQRNAKPSDVAKAVIFLASSLSSFTTGQKIMVTGGNAPFL